MTVDEFKNVVTRITGAIAGKPVDAALDDELNRRFPAGGAVFTDLSRALRTGIDEGWMCAREHDGIKYGRVIRPGLGVRPASDSIARRLGIRAGVLVAVVSDGSSAERAGMRGTIVRGSRIRQFGDIITHIDDKPVPDTNALLDVLEQYRIGDEVTVTFIRDDRRMQAKVKLQSV